MANKTTKTAKKQKVVGTNSVDDWSDGEIQYGMPTITLLPPKNYCFKVYKQEHKITVPRKGSYHKIDPDQYSEEEGEFKLFDEKSKVMYMPAITKVLFATKQYPDLGSNQVFAPIALVFRKNEVDIIGQVLEMIESPEPYVK